MINVDRAIRAIKSVDTLNADALCKSSLDGSTYCAVGAMLYYVGTTDSEMLFHGLSSTLVNRLWVKYELTEDMVYKLIALNDSARPCNRKRQVITALRRLANDQQG